MRGFLALVIWALSAAAPAADLQATLDGHLREAVGYWLDEPRLLELLRDASRKSAELTGEEIAGMAQRWQAEMAGAEMTGEGGELSDVVASRFGSKYLAEVALRLDGAYGTILALDNRGLVAAASELPEQMDLAGDVCVSRLLTHANAAWVQDRKPAEGRYTRVAMPVRGESGERIGMLLIDIDVARLPDAGLDGDQTRMRSAGMLSSARDDAAQHEALTR
ncbi:MAG: hypothetical protein ACOY3X_00580 [Pseudomonadota bacterium]